MKRTVKLYESEHYDFGDGTVLDRDEVTVSTFGKDSKGRTVWADVNDESCLYTFQHGLLWRFDGELL